jgi:hypothetical protein
MREAMFSAMFEGVIPEVPGVVFQSEPKQPEVQEQRIWEIDSDEEEKEEKKRAKKKRQYLRKKEKAQAEKAERQLQKAESEDAIAKDLADMSIQNVSADEHEPSSDAFNTSNTTQPKLSKRQKKTLLKKNKQAQAAISTPELGHSSGTGDTVSGSSPLKSKDVDEDEREKENKGRGTGHAKQDNKSEGGEDEVATESEVEAVMETISKRFGQ